MVSNILLIVNMFQYLIKPKVPEIHLIKPLTGGVRLPLLRHLPLRRVRGRPRRQRPRPVRSSEADHGRRPRPHQLQLLHSR